LAEEAGVRADPAAPPTYWGSLPWPASGSLRACRGVAGAGSGPDGGPPPARPTDGELEAVAWFAAADVAQQYPQYSTEILSAASQAFTDGKSVAIVVALAMTLIGLALVLVRFPGKAKEETYYEQIAASEPSSGQTQKTSAP
jgi:hypothetical protein